MRMLTKQRLSILACMGALAACSQPTTRADEPPVDDAKPPLHVKVLAFNDLHGYITGPSGSVMVQGAKVEAGGADYLAARVAAIRATHANTVVVTAGDMIGASPLVSSLFHDEPTIESLNALGLDATSVGNHEFDEGVDELRRMIQGGCHPTDGCQDGDDFAGATFPILAANVTVDATGETLFAGTFVKEFEGVKIGFIGLTLKGTPSIVSPAGVRGLSFKDEVETINAIVPTLQAQGIETIVVLIHEGGAPTGPINDVNDCADVSGPIVAIVENTNPAVDLFVTGHTHQPYICDMGGRLVTSAQSYARLLTEIDLQIDRKTGDVLNKKATNLVIAREGDAHPEVAQIVAKYSQFSDPLANKKIGAVKQDIGREPNEDGESPLGRLIADIQLEATKGKERGRAQIAFMNPGGIRAALDFKASGAEGDGIVTYAEAHAVQPFGNSLVTMTLTGQQIHDLLEAQWNNPDRVRLLQVSTGFSYSWSEKGPQGDHVDPKKILFRGKPIDLAAQYRVTVNSFLATGGDDFELLPTGIDRIGGEIDLEAFLVYFNGRKPIAAPIDRRIRKLK